MYSPSPTLQVLSLKEKPAQKTETPSTTNLDTPSISIWSFYLQFNAIVEIEKNDYFTETDVDTNTENISLNLFWFIS